MENECSVVKDLLPLYQENMVSEDTAIFLREHLATCSECGAYLQSYELNSHVVDTVDLARNREALQFKRRLRKVILSISLNILRLVALAFTVFMVFRYALDVCRFERDPFEIVLAFLYIHILFLPLLLAEWCLFGDTIYFLLSAKTFEITVLHGCSLLLSVAMVFINFLGLFHITSVWMVYFNPIYLILAAIIWGCILWQKKKK